MRKKPSLSEYDHCCIIVSGIPIVGENRLSKLKSVLGKIFGRIHPEFNDFYPVDDNGSTKVCSDEIFSDNSKLVGQKNLQ